jgi:hypothetical protein
MRGVAAACLLAVLAFRPAAAAELPAWAAPAFASPDFAAHYALSDRLDPALLEGDFDGDGRSDVAVLVTRRAGGASGIAILRAGTAQPSVVGAGRPLGNGGDDFAWMDAWSVAPGPPGARGDALLVEKREAASALVYWDGAAFRWLQQGD